MLSCLAEAAKSLAPLASLGLELRYAEVTDLHLRSPKRKPFRCSENLLVSEECCGAVVNRHGPLVGRRS